MNISKIKLSLLIFSSVLAGCTATPSALQLANENQWEMLGYQDGHAGNRQRTANELSILSTASDKAISEYYSGYLTGLDYFCDTDNAFLEGVTGRRYEGQCQIDRMKMIISLYGERVLVSMSLKC